MSHLGQAGAQRMATRMFAQHQLGLIDAHIFGAHDLIRGLVLQHAILMNARFMRKRIRTDNRLVRLHDNARVVADQFADTRRSAAFRSLFPDRKSACGSSSVITTSSSDVLPARSPIPLIVTSAWRAPARIPASVLAVAMPRSSWQWTEIVMPSCIPGVFLIMPSINAKIFIGRGVTDRIGNVQRGCACLDGFAQNDIQKFRVRASRIFRAEIQHPHTRNAHTPPFQKHAAPHLQDPS